MPGAGRDGVLRRRERGLVRLIHLGDDPAVVRAWAAGPCVRLRAESASRDAALHAVERMRFALGVDHDLSEFHREFKWHPLLGPIIRRKPWLRPRRRAEPWEALAWAITEQLIETERAQEIQRRLVYRYGRASACGTLRDAPSPVALAGRAPAELQACDLAGKRAIAMIRVAREVAAGRADLHHYEPTWRRLMTIREIGTWTVDKLAYEGQGRDDRLPAGDLAYIKLVGRLLRLGRRATEDEVREFFEPFAPFQGLAGTYLLHGRFVAG
jgi:3-methyladenine DNA glycosylase/8-oxoguanine DNA glycosylase